MTYQSRDYNLSLVAGQEFELRGIIGKFYRLKSVSVPGTTVQIQFDNSGNFTPLVQGDWGELPGYETVRLVAAINVDVVFYLGAQIQRSDAATLSIANVTSTPEINNGGVSPADVVIGAGLTATVSVARATKRQTIIGNPSTNTGNFRVGTGAGAGTGFLLEPGMSIGIDGSQIISAHNEGAAAEALTVTEVDKI